MKKGNIKSKKRLYIEDTLDWKLNWGSKGLKISFSVLIILVIMFLFVLLSITNNLEKSLDILFRSPERRDDWFGIFAGIIIFIALPFILGMYIGIKFKSKR